MRIDIVTIFPEMCITPLGESMMKRAREKGLVEIFVHDLRDYATGKHKQVDDIPYGGGQGMVMKPEPFFAILEKLKTAQSKVVLMTPQGRQFKQSIAEEYSTSEHLIILCGHYEGVDHRVVEALVDDEISIGDYVLTNGAIAAVIFTDAITRLIPGVLGDARSSVHESFGGERRILEEPCYTRPPEFNGMKVPEVLLSGHHGKIDAWKKEQAETRTRENRPDLFD